MQLHAGASVGSSIGDDSAFKKPLPSTSGKEQALSSFWAGAPACVFFFPKAGTPVCTSEARLFMKRSGQFQEAGASVVGVSGDSLQDLQKFSMDESFPFPLLSDTDNAMRHALGIGDMDRVTYVIRDGKVLLAFEDAQDFKAHVHKALEAVSSAGQAGGSGGSAQPYQPEQMSDKVNEAYTAAEQL